MRVAAGWLLPAALAWRLTTAAKSMSSRLQISIPPSFYRDNGYPHEMALFGIPKHGGTIAEEIIHGGILDGVQKTWTLCSSDDVNTFKQRMPLDSPFILMVDRGECTFASKVRRAQHLGASGVIIADNTCLCSDEAAQFCHTSQDIPCQQEEPTMVDDGSGADIAIPSFLMNKLDAKDIKIALSEGQNVQAEMAWSLPAPGDIVEWSMWTSAFDTSAAPFKRDFKGIVKALGNSAQFTPFYKIYDGASYGCTGTGASNCGSLCTNRGRYCTTDPDFDNKAGVTGADVVKESLRQKCIWNIYGGENADLEDQRGVGEKWWSYVNEFFSSCSGSEFKDANCVDGAMKAAGVDNDAVNRCMADSGGTEDDEDNAILEKELKQKGSKTIVMVPTVFVNNVAERGDISTAAVLSTICAGYKSGTEPEVCLCSGQPSSDLVAECMRGRGGSSVGGTMFFLGAVVGAMTAAGFASYYRFRQTQRRNQLRDIQEEGMPSEDFDAPGSSARAPLMSPEI